MKGPIISSKWLKEHINHPDLIILDASSLSDHSEIRSQDVKKIPHARYFDLKNNFSDTTSVFPNTFPSEEQFEQESRKLGINNSSLIVVYDTKDIYQSPRVWWMFKVMGHEKVAVLDGGLPDWISNGFETVNNYEVPKQFGDFSAKLDSVKVKSIDFILSNIESRNHLIIDVRSKGRFLGIDPEPRKGLRSGNIPQSINLPYTEVLDGTKYKPIEELKNIFEKTAIDERPLTFSCGSGVTACIVLLAAEMALNNNTSVYDGSWTEYGTLIKET